MPDFPILSVIIVSYQSENFLPLCLQSLRQHFKTVAHEVIIVDNNSTDGTREIAESFPEVIWIQNEVNLGFSKALNKGIRRSRGRFILWLNPDAQIKNDALGILLEYFDSHPKVGIIGPKINNPDGTRQYSCRSFPSYHTALFSRYSFISKLFPNNRFSRKYLGTDTDPESIHRVDWISGAAFLCRRQVWEQLQGLDEDYFMYCEDVDFCRRAKDKGWETYYHPALTVMHHVGQSSRKNFHKTLFAHHQSMWRYYRKHFRRNPVKDFFILTGISIRWVVLLLLSLLKKGGSR